MKRLFKFKNIIKILLLSVLFGIVYSFSFTVYENIRVDRMINTFKNRANSEPSLVEERSLAVGGKYVRKYFEVPRETKDEINSKNVFIDDKKNNLGQIGDIYVTQQSPFPHIFGLHQFMSYYYGGHAAIKSGEYEVVEATGYPDFENESLLEIIFSKGLKGHGYSPTASASSSAYWYTTRGHFDYYNNFYRSRYIGLRPINPFIEEDNSLELYDLYIDTSIYSAKDKIENEALYNFLFFLDTRRKYYCTDFVSRMYEEAYYKVMNNNDSYESKGYAKKMNDDGFITSVNDLILSKDTFITFYVEINEEEYLDETRIVENIYYLEDVDKV